MPTTTANMLQRWQAYRAERYVGHRIDVSGGHAGTRGSAQVVESIQSHHGMGGGGPYGGSSSSITTLPGGVPGRAGRTGNVHLSVDERFPGLASRVQVTRGSGATLASSLPIVPTAVSPGVAFKEEFLIGIPVEPMKQTPSVDSP